MQESKTSWFGTKFSELESQRTAKKIKYKRFSFPKRVYRQGFERMKGCHKLDRKRQHFPCYMRKVGCCDCGRLPWPRCCCWEASEWSVSSHVLSWRSRGGQIATTNSKGWGKSELISYPQLCLLLSSKRSSRVFATSIKLVTYWQITTSGVITLCFISRHMHFIFLCWLFCLIKNMFEMVANCSRPYTLHLSVLEEPWVLCLCLHEGN